MIVAALLTPGCRYFSKRPICEACGARINGPYTEDAGVFYHPGHFRCGYCEAPIVDEPYVALDGVKYHTYCFREEILVCEFCKNEKEDYSYVSFLGAVYHESCFPQVVRCAYCKDPDKDDTFVIYRGNYYHDSCLREHVLACAFCHLSIDEDNYITYEDKSYHQKCFDAHVALRCSFCGERIAGKHTKDFWGNTYHTTHDGAPACDFCRRLLNAEQRAGGIDYDDGRSLCKTCRPSAVCDEDTARQLAAKVSRKLRRLGIDVDEEDISFHLVDRDRLRELTKDRPHDVRGATTCQVGLDGRGQTQFSQFEVFLLYGMPEVGMIATIAHELTHVWTIQNGRSRTNWTLLEGSCNYASYLVLSEMPGEPSRFVMDSLLNDADRIYGGGFRRVKRYAEEHGTEGWLLLLTTNGDLPWY